VLEFDQGPFLRGLARLREEKFGAKMEAYLPPSESILGAMMSPDRDESPLSPQDCRLREIHAQWSDLHPVTRENLLHFEMDTFQLASGANGEVAVTNLVGDAINCLGVSDFFFYLLVEPAQ